MGIIPRDDYDHPGPLGWDLDLSRVTGWDIHHTAGALDETAYDVAATGVRRFGRSSYNFLVSQVHRPDDVWQMQGHEHVGAHNDGENSTRLGIVLPGYYHPPRNHRPTRRQLETVAWLMAYGHRQWGIPIHAKGHRDTDATACPGDYLQARIDSIVTDAQEDDMGWIEDKYPKWSWPWARKAAAAGVINKDTDPNKKVSELTVLELLIHLDGAADGVRGEWD